MTEQHHASRRAEPGAASGRTRVDPEPQGAGTGGADGARRTAAGPAPDGLRRGREQKMLGGVCAGLGQHYQLDPVIFRIVLAVLSLTGGLGLILYGFVWLFVPFEGEEENEARRLLAGRVDGPALTAVLFALIGCGVFLSMLGNDGVFIFGASLALLLAGAAYWSRQRGAASDPLAQAAADAPPEATAPPAPAAFRSWWRDPIVKDGTHVGGTGYLWGPADLEDVDAAQTESRTARGDVGTRPTRSPDPYTRHWIGSWVFLLALLAGSIGTALTWSSNALGTSLQTGLAAALGILGIGIAVSAVFGRTGAGSIALALITAALLAGASVLPKDITTDWIRTTWHPPGAAQVHPHYALGSGAGTLDLSSVHPTTGHTVRSHAKVAAGRLKVVIPRDATVRLRVEVGLGDIQLPGDDQQSSQDIDIAPDKERTVTLRPSDGRARGGLVDLHLEVGIGQVEVTRAAA
mgnify:CR=1 FL=1